MSLTLILSSDKDLLTNIRLIGILFSVVGDIGDMSEKSMSILISETALILMLNQLEI